MRNLFTVHGYGKSFTKKILILMMMISIGLSFNFSEESFSPSDEAIIIYDNFEANSFNGNWTIAGGTSNSWTITSAEEINGSYSAFATNVDGQETTMNSTAKFNTTGYIYVRVTFYADTVGLDPGDYISFRWWNGTAWNTTMTVEDLTLGTYSYEIQPSGWDNANFKVSFACWSEGTNEDCHLDDVRVLGIRPGGLKITNLSISPVNASSQNMDQYSLFNVTATAQCVGGGCGDVNASLYYNSTNLVPNTMVSNVTGATPFYVPLIDNSQIRPISYAGNCSSPTNAYDGGYNDTSTFMACTGFVGYTQRENYTYTTDGSSAVVFYSWKKNLGVGPGFWANISLFNFTSNTFFAVNSTNNTYTTLQVNSYSVSKSNGLISAGGNIIIDFWANLSSSGNQISCYDTYLYVPGAISNDNPSTCSAMLQGQNCTATWQVNATGTPGTQYYLNVSFNSESSYINPNSTGNFQINISAAGPAAYAFTITVPGGNYSNSSESFPGNFNPTMNFSYNGSWGGSQAYVNASFNYSGATNWQTSATPALTFTNLGTTALTWTIKLNNSLPSWVIIFANDTNTFPPTVTHIFNGDGLSLAVAASGTKSVWVYANFSNVQQSAGYANYTVLNHTST